MDDDDFLFPVTYGAARGCCISSIGTLQIDKRSCSAGPLQFIQSVIGSLEIDKRSCLADLPLSGVHYVWPKTKSWVHTLLSHVY